MLKNILKATITLLAVAIAMIGCADDDLVITSFSLEGSQNVYFEPGQTIKISYKKQRISKIEITEAPADWTVVNRNNSYLEVTAPNVLRTEAEVIEVKGTSPEGTSNSDKITVQVLIAESISEAGAANCYIAPTEGRFSFDGTTIAGSDKKIEFAKAELLWCAPKKAVHSVQTLDDNISFSTSGTDGNAVIAVRDSKDNILWSWHIWVADYNPTESAIEGMMSRNIGASADLADTDEEAWMASGLYYQWGRKDPFVGGKYYMSTVDQNMYDAEGNWVGITYLQTAKSRGTIAYTIANPLTYLYGAESTGYDWMFAERNNKLWGGATKSMYDPCPAGWRVASASAFDGAKMDAAVGDYLRGWEVSTAEGENYLVAAGRRSFADGQLTNVDVTGYLPVGFIWTADTNEGKATAVEFTPTSLGMGTAYRSNACPVRCCKEN